MTANPAGDLGRSRDPSATGRASRHSGDQPCQRMIAGHNLRKQVMVSLGPVAIPGY